MFSAIAEKYFKNVIFEIKKKHRNHTGLETLYKIVQMKTVSEGIQYHTKELAFTFSRQGTISVCSKSHRRLIFQVK